MTAADLAAAGLPTAGFTTLAFAVFALAALPTALAVDFAATAFAADLAEDLAADLATAFPAGFPTGRGCAFAAALDLAARADGATDVLDFTGAVLVFDAALAMASKRQHERDNSRRLTPRIYPGMQAMPETSAT
ncbi:MAG: hypothetical protein AB1586_03970 [Pseudomonadota bacterium]